MRFKFQNKSRLLSRSLSGEEPLTAAQLAIDSEKMREYSSLAELNTDLLRAKEDWDADIMDEFEDVRLQVEAYAKDTNLAETSEVSTVEIGKGGQASQSSSVKTDSDDDDDDIVEEWVWVCLASVSILMCCCFGFFRMRAQKKKEVEQRNRAENHLHVTQTALSDMPRHQISRSGSASQVAPSDNPIGASEQDIMVLNVCKQYETVLISYWY